MPAFLIADIEVHDPETYSQYTAATPDVVNKFGGKYVALRGQVKTLEGDWHPRRVAIIEFKDMDTLNAFYDSDEYKEISKIRWESSDSRFVAIETLPEPVERP